MPEPPREMEEMGLEVARMEIDGDRLPVPLRRLSESHRLLHPHRGAKLHGNIRDAPMSAAVSAMRAGVTVLPMHLERPLSLFSKFHLLARRRGHAMEVFLGMYDKTGTRLFTGSDDWLIKIWSTHSGLLVNTLRGHKAAITYLCIDPTNQYLASASDDNTVRIWSLATYTNVAVLQHAHTKSVVELSWSPSGNIITSMALDGFINAWELLPIQLSSNRKNNTGNNEEGSPQLSLPFHDLQLNSSSSLPVHHTRSSHLTSNVEIETLLGKDVMLKFRHSHLEPVNNSPCQSGPLSPCGTRALVSCKDGSVRILALSPLRQIQRIVAHGANVPLAVWANGSASRFATACDDGTSKIYEYMNATRGWVLKHSMPVLDVPVTGTKPKMLGAKWSMNDDLLILSFQRTAAQHFHHLKVFDTQSGKCLGNLIGHSHDVHSLAIHPSDHRILATAGYDQRIIIWNLYTLSPVAVLELPNYEDEESPITEICWHPNGTQLLVTDIIGTFTLFGIGPSDSFKGPTEQFFSTDYNETTIDDNGFVVDNETQLPPHLTKRTPLCFRTGLVHDSPPILPPLNDPRARLSSEEVRHGLERRSQEADAEDAQFPVGEPVPEARVPRNASLMGVGGAIVGGVVGPAVGGGGGAGGIGGGGGGGGGGGVASAVSAGTGGSLGRVRSSGGVLASHGFSITSHGRLRRNADDSSIRSSYGSGSTAPPLLGPDGQPIRRGRGRPKRAAAAPSHIDDDDIMLLSDDDEELKAALEASRMAQLAKEDEEEEDFEAGSMSESDESILSDGGGQRIRSDRIDDDLYWSGDEATAEFLSPAERRAMRESRRLTARSSSRPPSRASANRRRTNEDDDSDEDYGARRRNRNRNRSSSAAPTAAAASSSRPTRSTKSSSSANSHRKRKSDEGRGDDDDEEDGFLDIMSNASSDIPLFDSGDEDYKASGVGSGGGRGSSSAAGQKEKQRERTGKIKPPEYPSWVIQEAPSAIFCPQLDDELVFFQSGYEKYLETFAKHFKGDSVPSLPPNLPPICYCVVTAVEFQSDPILHARVTLSTLTPPLPIPALDTDPSHETSSIPSSTPADTATSANDSNNAMDVSSSTAATEENKNGGAAKKKGLKVKISVNANPSASTTSVNHVPPPVESKPYISMRDTAARLSVTSSSSSSTTMESSSLSNQATSNGSSTNTAADANTNHSPLVFQVCYHGNADVPDYLVLATRFNQGMAMPWYPSKRVSAWIASEDDPNEGEDYPGTVLETHPESPWEAVTILWEDESSGTERMSPWELEAMVVQNPNPSSGGGSGSGEGSSSSADSTRIPVLVETLEESTRSKMFEAMEAYIRANAEICEIFRLPVPLSQWPSYYAENPWPVHLKLLLSRIRTGWYRNVQSLKRDIQCIHLNSRNFNGDSPITENARVVASSLDQIVDQFAPNIVMVPKTPNLNGSHFMDESDASQTNTSTASMKKKSQAKSSSSAKSKARAPFEEFGSELDGGEEEEEEDAMVHEEEDVDDEEKDESYGARRRRTSHASSRATARSSHSKSKHRNKKRKRGTFGEVYESESTDPDDLLPYSPPPAVKKAVPKIVDPGQFIPVHAENQAQRDADAAAEVAISQSRIASSSNTSSSAPIAPIESSAPSIPTGEETTSAALPRTRLRVKVPTAPPTAPSPSPAPSSSITGTRITRARSQSQTADQEVVLAHLTPAVPIESPSGRPVRSTRAKRNFATLDAPITDLYSEEEEEEPAPRSSRSSRRR